MPAMDNALLTYAKLWTIWEADLAPGGWASMVEIGNRIRFDKQVPQPQKRARQAGDFIEFELGLGGFIDDLDRSSMTFCGAAEEVLDQTYVATISTASSDQSDLTKVALRTLQLIRQAPKNLTLSFVDEVLRCTAIEPRQVILDNAAGQRRWQMQLRILVRMKFRSNS